LKRLHHPVLGPIELEFSTFAVEGRPDLTMMIYNPSTAETTEAVRKLVESGTPG
jgi:hypothetical protein